MSMKEVVWAIVNYKRMPVKTKLNNTEVISLGRDIRINRYNDKNVITLQWEQTSLIDIKKTLHKLYGIKLKFMERDKLVLDYGIGRVIFDYKEFKIHMCKDNDTYTIKLETKNDKHQVC